MQCTAVLSHSTTRHNLLYNPACTHHTEQHATLTYKEGVPNIRALHMSNQGTRVRQVCGTNPHSAGTSLGQPTSQPASYPLEAGPDKASSWAHADQMPQLSESESFQTQPLAELQQP